MQSTPNLGLQKPDGSDVVDIAVLNGNSDILDFELAKKAALISPGLSGTPTTPTAAPDTNSNQIASTAFVIGQAGTATPSMDGTAYSGSSVRFARQDHVHPTDASRASLTSPSFNGTPSAPTAPADTNSNQLATTSFVIGQAGTATPLVDGGATAGSSLRFARQDHVHPTDTSRAPITSPGFNGTPTAPTATAGTNSIQIATTAFVATAVASSTPAKASVSNVLLSSTSTTTVAAYTPPVTGNYMIGIYLRVLSTSTITIAVWYADSAGAQTTTLLNAQSTAAGSYSLLPVFINAAAGNTVSVVVTAGTANQVYASASIVGV